MTTTTNTTPDKYSDPKAWAAAMADREPMLSAIFDVVKNPADWRAPIDHRMRGSKDEPIVRLICEAIEFYTATTATVTVEADGGLRIQADGYRMGPAGP